MTTRILTGDCREVMKTLEAESIHACVTDPPYELTSARPGGRSEATRGAVMGGFMGMKWDGTGVAFDVATWAEVLRVLKPGGFLLAFGGTRTHHRMMCAIEDAGFELRDCLGWLYGSGFPKSRNLDGDWKGWGTALKPAWEPIIMARKPFKGTIADNVQAHGVGAINIDGCRISYENDVADPASNPLFRKVAGFKNANAADANSTSFTLKDGGGERNPNTLGRWPANILHDGSDDVLSIFPDAPGQLADISETAPSAKTSGIYGAMKRTGEPSADNANEGAVGFNMKPGARRGDVGSAARFFYCAKVSQAEREVGLAAKGKRLFGMSGAAAAAAARGEHYDNGDGGVNKTRLVANHHPTVKPVELMRYLIRLVTPPGGIVLDCFAGSGSTLRAADIEGFSAIGIEQNPEYVEIAKSRINGDMPLFAAAE